MAGHVWNVVAFTSATVETAKEALTLAVRAGCGPKVCVSFVGYAVESLRQKGGISVKAIWSGAWGSNHRYSRGRNAVNYYQAGSRLVACMASEVGLTEDAPVEAIIDNLQEDGII